MISEQISVMVVESQPLMRTALSTALSAEGMTVLAEVAESRHAVQTAKKFNPNLILFSVIAPPSLSDLTKISALRQELPSTLILALVTGEFYGQEQTALEHGAHMALTKNAPRSELLDAIKRLKNTQFASQS